MESSEKHVGRRIHLAREILQISGEELSKRLKMHGLELNASVVYRYEKGNVSRFPIKYVEPFAKALNVSREYIMGWEEKQEKLPIKDGFVPVRVISSNIDKDDLSKVQPIGVVQFAPEAKKEDHHYFGIQMVDDSLYPVLMRQDICIVDLEVDFYTEKGLYLVQLRGDGQFIIRQVVVENGFYVLSTHDVMAPVTRLKSTQADIIGKLVEVRRLI